MKEIAGFCELSFASTIDYARELYSYEWRLFREICGFIEDDIEFPYPIEDSFIISEVDENVFNSIDSVIEKTKYNLISYSSDNICFINFIDIYSAFIRSHEKLISLIDSPLNKYQQKLFSDNYIISKPQNEKFYVMHPKNYYLKKYNEILSIDTQMNISCNQKSLITLSEFMKILEKCKQTGDSALTNLYVFSLCRRKQISDINNINLENEIVSNEYKLEKRNILMSYRVNSYIECASIEYILTSVHLLKENGIFEIHTKEHTKEIFHQFINYLRRNEINFTIVDTLKIEG